MVQILRDWTATWTATGKATIDRIVDRTSTLECSIPLRQQSSSASDQQQSSASDLQHVGGKVTLIEVLRSGNSLTATVDLTDISSGQFKDFPFRPINVVQDSGEEVLLVATYIHPPGSPAILCGQQAKIKVQEDKPTDDLCLNLNIEWTWNLKFYLEQDTIYRPVAPLTLHGDEYKGWEASRSLVLPNGDVKTETLDFVDDIVDWLQNAVFIVPESGEYEYTMTAKRSRSLLGTVLRLGAEDIKKSTSD